MNNITQTILPALCATQLFASTASAAVVIDNLTAGTIGSGATISGINGDVFSIPIGQADIAFPFTTSSLGGIFTNLTINMGTDGIGNNSQIVTTISTGTAVSGGVNPITFATVTPNINPSLNQLVDFTPTSPITLNPNTQYWINLSIPAATTSTYTMRSTNSVMTDPGWSLGSTHTRNGGNSSSWLELTPNGNGEHAQPSIALTVVPEPASALLGGLSMLMLLRRKR